MYLVGFSESYENRTHNIYILVADGVPLGRLHAQKRPDVRLICFLFIWQLETERCSHFRIVFRPDFSVMCFNDFLRN